MRTISPHLSKLAVIATTSFALWGGGLALATWTSACGGDGGDTTTGARVVLHTEIVADDGVEAPFVNAFGWSIQLSKALISVGPLYFFDGAPIFSKLELLPSEPTSPWQDVLGLRVAHAHPGHYQQGNAMGQVLGSTAVDLALGATPMIDGDGVTGSYRSGRFSWVFPAVGPEAAGLGTAAILVEGSGTKDGKTRIFRMIATKEDVLDSYNEPKIDGCAFQETDVQGSGTVSVHILPSIWLDQAELEFVAESTDGEPVELQDGEEAQRAFERGVKKGTAYKFSFTPD